MLSKGRAEAESGRPICWSIHSNSVEMSGGADENAGKRPRVDTYDSSPAAAAGGGGCSTGVAVDGGQPSDQGVHPVIDWADKANVCRLVPLLKKIKSLEAQTAAVLSEVRPHVTPTLADKVPGLSSKLMTVEQSVASRHDTLRGLIKTLDNVAVAKPPLPQPIATKTLPPDATITQLGRPSLDGLPPDVAHIVLAFLPTKDSAPLSRVNQSMRHLVTDDTRGVANEEDVQEDEEEQEKEEDQGGEGNDEEGEGEDDSAGEGAAGGADLRRQREETLPILKQKLGRLRTVHISAHWKALDFPLECIEASRDTVRSMKLCEKRLENDDEFEDYPYSVPTSPSTVTFSQLEDLYVEQWPDHRGFRGWRFPSLLRLRVGGRGWHAKDIVEHAPKLTSLWITDIEWVELCPYDFTWKLGRLKSALDPIWSKDSLKDVEKRIGLAYSNYISVPFTNELLHPTGRDQMSLPAFVNWAASVKCTVDWSAGWLVIDCSRDLVISPPAPTGPMAKMIKDVSKTAYKMTLRCGGKPLDQSWAGLLVFTMATELSVEGLTSSRALSSVPQWMAAKSDTTGGNRHLPNVTSLNLHADHRVSADAAGLNGLGALLGTLDRLTAVSLACLSNLGVAAFCLSQLPPTVTLESVEVVASVCGSDVPATSDCTRYPHVASMTVEVINSKTMSGVASGVALIAAVRPATVCLKASVDLSALHNREGGESREAEFRRGVEQCIDQAERDHYGLIANESRAGDFDEEGYPARVELQLVRLPTHS
ncbi:unnamed protein product [Vitrella brassicaformis CCMP3155]|uniref:F-box domain-containing protein n=1 Tax=Vitrella brassicaformis (strain CCMP3155) TaxID=1169540 RepID=A0A0G4GIG5_VITBC|nr:unnamed protein product [Vitrella brassicaformis CCMP3155]|eukprot:CEM29374.1 unnamed protein product [Vitrella brassicaformis CCMP3155]